MEHKFKAYIEEEQRIIDVHSIYFYRLSNVAQEELIVVIEKDEHNIYFIPPEHLLPYIITKNKVDIFYGDICKTNRYPFYGDGLPLNDGKDNPEELNYLGVIGVDIDGAYYDLNVVSDRVCGRASGGNLSEILDEPSFEIIGHALLNPELLEGE